MASGIAYAVALAGQDALVLGRSASSLQRAQAQVARAAALAAERDRLGGQSVDEVLGRITTTTEPVELDVCDLVIEAVSEDLAIKRGLFADLDRALPNVEFLATNTSSLQVREIASAVQRPDRLGGIHFFSPVAAMRLVEVVSCERLPEGLMNRAAAWARSIGKVPVRCADRSGFIVNALLIPFLNDVVRAGSEGAGSPAELDEILVTEAGHPMGPFQLLDFIGLDVSLAAQEALFASDRGNERLRPAASLVDHVARGHLGRKSGRGFYEYAPAQVAR
jgi:3-hydroxybutyryl-CoA dehydrogenase